MSVLHSALSGSSQRPAFLPWIWELAASRVGLDVKAMTSSATELVAAVTEAAALVESDALVVLVDVPDGPILEGLRRLVTTGGDRDVVAVTPGPILLAERARLTDPDDRDDVMEDIARSVFESGVRVLAIDEPAPDVATAPTFRTLARMARYYGARTLAIGPGGLDFTIDAGFDAVDGGRAGPAAAGVPVASTFDEQTRLAIVTTSWAPRSADADSLRSLSRRVHHK